MSNLINKVKDAVSSDKTSHGHNTTTTGHSTTGTTTGHSTTGTTAGYSTTGTTATHGEPVVGGTTAGTSGPATRTDGPHSSNALNKADPRIDSDRDYSRNMGANPHGTATTGSTHTGQAGGAIPSTTTTTHAPVGSTGGAIPSTTTHAPVGTTGTTPHSSHTANVADPRINTSRQHETAPLGSTGHGTTSGHSTAPLSSTGHGTTTGHTTAPVGAHGAVGGTGLGTSTGPAPNTAGPHGSDMLNKADPRVDSNLDGSKTVGGDKTFAQTGATSGGLQHKDPTDATQVPPSVLQKHVGGPTVHHEDVAHEREKRHSISHQEQHRGL